MNTDTKLFHNMEAIGISAITGLVAGAVVIGTQRVDEGNISLSAACACMVFVGGIIWLLASRFQKIDDRLDKIESHIKNNKEIE